MKFQKHLEWHLVPEWRDYYCNYKQLKQDLKKIKKHRSQDVRDSMGFTSSLVQRYRSIQQNKFMVVHPEGCHGCELQGISFKTELTSANEHESRFFNTLDLQLNLVNKFYVSKEAEYDLRANRMNTQLAALLELQKQLPSIDDSSFATEVANADMSFSEASRAKKLLCDDFSELYRGLVLLRNYSLLNRMAFRKILKKFDKMTGWKTSPVYMRVVEMSYFSSSDKVLDLMEQVEKLFIQHFAEGDRQAAKAYLHPLPPASHSMNFFLGLSSGCCLGFLVAFVLLLMLPHKTVRAYHILTTFPVFSTLALFLLHLCMYGCNLYFWQRARINYASMFEFAPRTVLRYQDMMFISIVLTTLLISGMVACLFVDSAQSLIMGVKYIPLLIILVFLTLLVLPFNIFYKSTRFTFLCMMFRILCSPFFKVPLADFFLADQLTSQGSGLKGLGFSFCYYGTDYLRHNTAACNDVTYQYIILLLPQWWRLLQCLRKWVGERDQLQLANGGKYLCAMIAIMAKFTYARMHSTVWWAIFIVTSTSATMYQLYWDVVMDWGLLRQKSRNPWLRDQLIIEQKSVYVISIIINSLLRFAWLHSMVTLKIGATDQMVVEFIFASIEVIRRGLWNFYRLENEYCNNVLKFSTVRSVPLEAMEDGMQKHYTSV